MWTATHTTAWTHSGTGDLVSVPRENQFGRVDKTCYSLTVLPALERDGLLWVHPDPEGVIDLDEQLGDLMKGFGEIIRDEDYAAAALSHRGMAAGHMDHVVFDRNEPALHHYHNTYREALGMPPLETS